MRFYDKIWSSCKYNILLLLCLATSCLKITCNIKTNIAVVITRVRKRFHIYLIRHFYLTCWKKSNTCCLQILNRSVLKIIIILNSLNFKYINIHKCFPYERISWKMIIRTRPGLILQNWYSWIRDIEGTNVAWQLKGIVSCCSWVIPEWRNLSRRYTDLIAIIEYEGSGITSWTLVLDSLETYLRAASHNPLTRQLC